MERHVRTSRAKPTARTRNASRASAVSTVPAKRARPQRTPAKPAATPEGGRWGKTAASQQRRRDIAMAAKAVFLEDGYQLASMDRVAAVANTTKRTLYDHFGSKEALFTASIEHGCALFVGKLPSVDELPDDPRAAIALFVARMTEVINAPNVIRFQRIVIAEAERHPEFSRQLHDAAFATTEAVLCAYLERHVARGTLVAHDVATWARLLIGLATNLGHTRALMGVAHAASADREARARSELIELYVDKHRAR